MKQKYTSAATSVNAAKLPKVFRKLPPLPRHSLLFDYGCGRFTDHIAAAVPGVMYCPYDPFNQPADVNARSLYYVRIAMHIHYPVTVVCSNVLNVIDSDDEVQDIAATIRQIIDASGGTAYVTAYAGNRSGIGQQTGPDQYQRNAPLRDYLRFFPGAAIENGVIVVRSGEARA